MVDNFQITVVQRLVVQVGHLRQKQHPQNRKQGPNQTKQYSCEPEIFLFKITGAEYDGIGRA